MPNSNTTQYSMHPPGHIQAPSHSKRNFRVPLWLAMGMGLAFLITLFGGGLAPMLDAWQTEEYSHAYLIPVIALLLMGQKIVTTPLSTKGVSNSLIWYGCGLILLTIGVFSTLNALIQYGFIFALAGILISLLGQQALKTLWPGLIYLVFMIPMPTLIENNLSHELQLLSSKIGVAFVRLFGISVYLEGNVIDLGAMKLQVVEACSGLRYLFPLMSFGFLIAVLYKGPTWQKITLFLATIPITILMNSVRIGIVGITVEHFGLSAAEGFLHFFEGWIVFILCLLFLYFVLLIMRKISGGKGDVIEHLNLTWPPTTLLFATLNQPVIRPFYFYWILAFSLAAMAMTSLFQGRPGVLPDRTEFFHFPLVHQGWLGREEKLSNEVLDNLKLTDYFYATYTQRDAIAPINFYMAYYASQKKGAGIHSPRSCIPGGGWAIESIEKVAFPTLKNLVSPTESFEVNRVLIKKGEFRSVVYYWFQQNGRMVTNEYLNRWYILVDSILKNRSDGALVRISIPWPKDTHLNQIEAQAKTFMQDFYPVLPQYLPN